MFRALCPLHGYELFEILADSMPPIPTLCQVNGVTPLTNAFFTVKEWANPAELITTVSLADASPPVAGQASIVVDGVGPDMTVRTIQQGTSILVTQLANSVQIDAAVPTITLANAVAPGIGEASIITDGMGPDLAVRLIKQGSNVTVTQNTDTVQIDATVPSITLADAAVPGAGEVSVVSDGVGPDLAVRLLKQGTNITLTQAANTVTITGANTTTLGQATPGAGEAGLMIDTVGPAMSIRILKEGANITLTENVNDVTIASTNVTLADASSPGAGEASLVSDGTGPALTVRKIKQGTNMTVTQNANDVTVASSIAAAILQRSIHVGADNPYPVNGTGTFEDAISFVWMGTTAYGASPATFKAVIGMAGDAAAECTARLYDLTNGNTIAGPNAGTNNQNIITLTPNAAASSSAAIWVLQCRRTAGSNNVSTSGVSIIF